MYNVFEIFLIINNIEMNFNNFKTHVHFTAIYIETFCDLDIHWP